MSKYYLGKFAKSRGFTLIELLIAIVIITILTTVGIAGFNNISRSNATFQKGQEIQSLVRKLRTDATAAVKPITGDAQTNSCKSPDPLLPQDLGTLYGSYIIFDKSTTPGTYVYGISCFKSDGTNVSSISTPQTLPDNMVLDYFDSNKLLIFYDFLGKVYTYDSITFTGPSNAYVTALPATDLIPATPVSLTVSYPSNTNSAYIYFGATGLVCVQKTITTPTCAG